jgi:hypothetical protein
MRPKKLVPFLLGSPIQNNLPAELLNKKDIIIEVKDNFIGWFTADLDQYDIF